MNCAEEWRQIPDYPDYSISSHGRVKRLSRASGTQAGRILIPGVSSRGSGYKYFNASKGGKVKTVTIHRSVAAAFIGPPPTSMHHAAHINGDSLDNRPENLKWKTPKENSSDRILHGKSCRGKNHYSYKLKGGK